MQELSRGRLATIDGTFGVEDLDDVKGQNTLNGRPSSAINIRRRGTLPSGQRWVAGEAARRKEDREQVPKISPKGNIDFTHEDTVLEEYSAWAMVPGEFAVVWEDWALNHLKYNYPVWEYTEQDIRLTRFFDDNGFSSVGSVGFKARQDAAEKGTVHGFNVPEDHALGADLEDGSLINELRYEHHPEVIVDRVSAYVAASGYVEVYNPSELTTEEFLSYVRDEILPYCVGVDEDEDSD